MLRSGVFGDLPPEDIGQNLATAGASAQSIAMASSELLISIFPFTSGAGYLCGRPEGLARTARGLTCRGEWQQGSGAVPAGRRGQMAVRPPSAAMTAPVM